MIYGKVTGHTGWNQEHGVCGVPKLLIFPLRQFLADLVHLRPRAYGGGWRRVYAMPCRDLQALEWLSILRPVPVRQVLHGGWCNHARSFL